MSASFSLLSRVCLFLLRPCSSFGLVWLRLSCGHDWIRSGSVNVRYLVNNNVYDYVCFFAVFLLPAVYQVPGIGDCGIGPAPVLFLGS